jgi:beta-ribofuranosylaminobenzene 5'-phosphate synthase
MSSGKRTFEIIAPSRIHFGLHDCGYSTDRIFGGVGVSFNGFQTLVQVKMSTKSEILYDKNISVSNRTIDSINELLSNLHRLTEPTSIHIKRTAPEHHGLGSKTTLLLSIAKSSIMSSGEGKKFSQDDIVRLSNRGGASGVGVNSFWTGGLVADSGHLEDHSKRNFQPSSRRDITIVPKIVSRVDMPANWRISLFIDPLAKIYEGATESEVFSKNMPINDSENLRAIAITYQGIIPSVLENDIKQFSKAIYDMNHCGMKSIEVGLQTEMSKIFMEKAWGLHYAAGVSSFGPTIYVIHENIDSNFSQIKRIAKSSGIDYLGTFEFNNTGAVFL